jgi:hypothetical protein
VKPPCAYCSKPLRLAPKYIRERGRALTGDGAPPTYGYEGNNVVCSSRCGMLVCIGLLRAEPAIMSLLPDGWNKRARRTACPD